MSPEPCQESLRTRAAPSFSQPEVIGLQLSWGEKHGGSSLSPGATSLPGSSWCQGSPRSLCSPVPGKAPPTCWTLLDTLSAATKRPGLCGPIRDKAEGGAPALCVPHLWSSCPSLVPEERGGQLRAPGCFQRRPAHGEHWSHTGELGRGLLGMSPPRPWGRTQGRSQSLVLPVFVGHLPWASFAVSIPATAELP